MSVMSDEPRDFMVKEEMVISPPANRYDMPTQRSTWFRECFQKDKCPYLNFRPASEVLEERDHLSKRVVEMEGIMRLAEEEIGNLREKVKLLEEEKQSLQQELNQSYRKPFKPNLREVEEQKLVKRKKGAPIGHMGKTRKRPEKVDEYVNIYPNKCAICGSKDITVYKSSEEHIVEDVQIRVKTTCFRKHYGYCPGCKKVIYPSDERIIPKSRIGPVARAVGGYLRYLGIPFRKVKKIFKNVFNFEISHPTLLDFDTQMAEKGLPLYEQIKCLVRHSSWIHADETGWRVAGINHWLWNFTNEDLALYRIEKSRGSEVVKETLGEKYDGFVISDFYSAYNSIEAKGKQKCIGHLLDEIKNIEEKNKFPERSQEQLFCQNLKVILKESLEVWRRFKGKEISFATLKQSKEIIAQQLTKLLLYRLENKDVQRLRKRIIKHNKALLTFLEHPEIEPTNNRAERQLRPNVILRKITFGNRSDTGARNHSVIMSIVQTAILKGANPFNIFLSLTGNSSSAGKQDLLFTVQRTRAP